MTTQNRIFDDISKLMTNAMGVAQGAKSEAETAFKGWVDRWLAERDFVTREEFEAVREMAVKARTEATELRVRLDRLDPAGAAPTPANPASATDAPASQGMGESTRGTTSHTAMPVSEADAPASAAMGGAVAEAHRDNGSDALPPQG